MTRPTLGFFLACHRCSLVSPFPHNISAITHFHNHGCALNNFNTKCLRFIPSKVSCSLDRGYPPKLLSSFFSSLWILL